MTEGRHRKMTREIRLDKVKGVGGSEYRVN